MSHRQKEGGGGGKEEDYTLLGGTLPGEGVYTGTYCTYLKYNSIKFHLCI